MPSSRNRSFLASICCVPSSGCLPLIASFAISMLCAQTYATAQVHEKLLGSQTEVSILKVPEPEYPPIAKAARVSGDVRVALKIRRDGSVESADVIDGAAMLRQTSIALARTLLFDCRNCTTEGVSYQLTCQFRITPTDPPKNCDEPPPQKILATIDQSKHVITISTPEIWTCDPAAEVTKTYYRVRAPRCLYMWRCGLREAQ